MIDEDIEERISNMIKVYSIWIKKKMRSYILNYYYFVENGTWLCDITTLYQLSNNWLSDFRVPEDTE